MWSVQKQDFLWAEWVSALVTELSPDGRKRGLLGLGGACETSRLFLLLPTRGSGVGRGLGFGPGAPLSLDWGENSVGSWHDGNAVGEGVEDERCSCSPIALGKGRVALQGLPPRMVLLRCLVWWIIAQASKQGSQLLPSFPPQVVYL